VKYYKKIRNILWKYKKGFQYALMVKKIFQDKSHKRIILIGTPEHGNLGDHAIAIAEKNFFGEKLADFSVVEVTGNTFRFAKKNVKRKAGNDDIILITGGGSVGNVWMIEQELIKDVIKLFSHNKIVIMPQTVYFTSDEHVEEEKKEFEKLCSGHNNLYIICRDVASYKEMKKSISNCFCLPDMVLYTPYESVCKRDGIKICFREDAEAVLPMNEKEEIFDFLKTKSDKITCFSTIYPCSVTPDKREERLDEIISDISSAELIVTDRLHAMLFAAITGTPCIAFDNCSKKVRGVYEWIKELEYIKIADDANDLKIKFDELDLASEYKYDKKMLEKYYDELAGIITN